MSKSFFHHRLPTSLRRGFVVAILLTFVALPLSQGVTLAQTVPPPPTATVFLVIAPPPGTVVIDAEILTVLPPFIPPVVGAGVVGFIPAAEGEVVGALTLLLPGGPAVTLLVPAAPDTGLFVRVQPLEPVELPAPLPEGVGDPIFALEVSIFSETGEALQAFSPPVTFGTLLPLTQPPATFELPAPLPDEAAAPVFALPVSNFSTRGEGLQAFSFPKTMGTFLPLAQPPVPFELLRFEAATEQFHPLSAKVVPSTVPGRTALQAQLSRPTIVVLVPITGGVAAGALETATGVGAAAVPETVIPAGLPDTGGVRGADAAPWAVLLATGLGFAGAFGLRRRQVSR